MPFTVARIEPDWLPLDPEESAAEPKHFFTSALIFHTDRMVAKAINEIDDSALRSNEVVVYVERNHPWCKNVSTFCFDVQPGNGGKEIPLEQAIRRAAIEDVPGRELSRFFDEHLERLVPMNGTLTPYPMFDIEFRPISGTGSTYQHMPERYGAPKGYRPTTRWGKRDFES